ncbi:MAG: YitT family protein [Clostridium sp.]|nr:YitT family protein [Enterocloster asparagiformis]MCD7908118.1 YitT family protein [Clostridium sp.]
MKQYKALTPYLLIILGSFIMGFAIKNMYDPVNLVTGGVSGIAIIVKKVVGLPLWLTNTVLNIPLFLAAWRLKGWGFIKRTLVATVALSVSLYILPERTFLAGDLFLSSLFGGVVSGIGTGIVFAFRATTGGTDMLASLVQLKLRHYSIAQIMQVLDGAVVLAGASIFGIQYALYAMIAIYAVCKISDGILDGMKFSKQAVIISDKSAEIANAVLENMERGVTSVEAMGMYSGQRRKMLFCVVSRREIVQIRDIVRRFDRQAFMFVNDVREVFGEGFIEELH